MTDAAEKELLDNAMLILTLNPGARREVLAYVYGRGVMDGMMKMAERSKENGEKELSI